MAVAHKMLRIVFAILRKKETYKDFTVNYEEVMVKRNAPRWIKALLKYDLMPSWLKVRKI
jgi:hypothetical protein